MKIKYIYGVKGSTFYFLNQVYDAQRENSTILLYSKRKAQISHYIIAVRFGPSTSQSKFNGWIFFIVLGFNDTSILWVILYRLPEKGRKEIKNIVEEMKVRDREERGTGMKVKKQNK